MKKIFTAVIIMTAVSAVSVFGSERLPLKDTPYYYECGETGYNYTLYDKDGSIISENEYDVIKPGGGKIIARILEYGQKYSILDQDLNILTEPRFSQIDYNENTQTFECLTWGEGPDKIEFFDSDINPVPQPRDIRKLGDTDCFYERVIDEKAEISGGYISYFICDADGNRLSDTEYKDIKCISDKIVVTDMNGAMTTYTDLAQLIDRSSASQWARESINNAISVGIVPEALQADYTKKISRREFCRLAVQTYMAKTGHELDGALTSPFDDVSDEYVTAAYELGIVRGTGQNKFSPDSFITRQEAAVMLNNLAGILNIKGNGRTEKFIDEEYFAQWARDAIYSIASVKSGAGYVMMGTEPNKFSPWMNYTREQAIATMLRLYNCRDSKSISDGQYTQPVGGEWLYCSGGEYDSKSDELYYIIYRVKKDGSEQQELLKDRSCGISFVTDEFIYYTSEGKFYRMGLAGAEKTEISQNELDSAYMLTSRETFDEEYHYYLAEIGAKA